MINYKTVNWKSLLMQLCWKLSKLSHPAWMHSNKNWQNFTLMSRHERELVMGHICSLYICLPQSDSLSVHPFICLTQRQSWSDFSSLLLLLKVTGHALLCAWNCQRPFPDVFSSAESAPLSPPPPWQKLRHKQSFFFFPDNDCVEKLINNLCSLCES